MNEIISTKKAPDAIGPYNQATALGNLVFTSGQIPLIPETMEIVEGGIKEQSKVVMDNFASFNEVYAQYFEAQTAPSRATVAVKTLPKNVLVEVDAIAFKN